MSVPSYRQGFASPERGNILYPSLWRNCVGAWCPSLGFTAGTLHDQSGKRKSATLVNPSLATDWVISGGKPAVRLTAGESQYFDCGVNKALNITGAITISAWVKLNSLGEYQVVAKDNNTGGRAYTLDLSSIYDYRFYINGGASDIVVTGNIVSTGTWHHLVGTYLPSTFIKIYQNGFLFAAKYSSVAAAIPTATANCFIGARQYLSFEGYMDGDIDDIRIYNRAISRAEIKLLASRRGIAYESMGQALLPVAAATNSGANLLMGVG